MKLFFLLLKVSGKEAQVLSTRCNKMGIRELRFSEPDGPALHYDPPNEESFGDQPLVGNEIMFCVLDQGMLTEGGGFLSMGLSRPLFLIILLSFVHLSCCHIHTFHDFLDYGTLLSPELE
jgi:hypothetical protein